MKLRTKVILLNLISFILTIFFICIIYIITERENEEIEMMRINQEQTVLSNYEVLYNGVMFSKLQAFDTWAEMTNYFSLKDIKKKKEWEFYNLNGILDVFNLDGFYIWNKTSLSFSTSRINSVAKDSLVYNLEGLTNRKIFVNMFDDFLVKTYISPVVVSNIVGYVGASRIIPFSNYLDSYNISKEDKGGSIKLNNLYYTPKQPYKIKNNSIFYAIPIIFCVFLISLCFNYIVIYSPILKILSFLETNNFSLIEKLRNKRTDEIGLLIKKILTIKQKEKKFYTSFNNINLPFCVVNLDGGVEYINEYLKDALFTNSSKSDEEGRNQNNIYIWEIIEDFDISRIKRVLESPLNNGYFVSRLKVNYGNLNYAFFIGLTYNDIGRIDSIVILGFNLDRIKKLLFS